MYHYFIRWYILAKIYILQNVLHDINQKNEQKGFASSFYLLLPLSHITNNYMNLQFNIEYKTYYGQELVLNIVGNEGSEANSVCQYRMHTYDGLVWTVDINKEIKPGTVIDYFYSVHVGDHEERRGWSVAPHRVMFNSSQALNYRIFDHWREIPDNAFLYSSAVTDCIVGAKPENLKLEKFSKYVCLKVRAPQLSVGDSLYLIGADPLLGSWKEQKAVKMTQVSTNEWAVCFDVNRLASNKLEFKVYYCKL